MVLSMDNTCSAASFDMELCAEKLQSLGVQVSSSPLISPGGPLEWMLAGLTLFAPRSQRAFLSFFFFFFRGCKVGLFQFNFNLFLTDFKTTVMTLA